MNQKCPIFLEGLYGTQRQQGLLLAHQQNENGARQKVPRDSTHTISRSPNWTKAPASHFALRPYINLHFLCIPTPRSSCSICHVTSRGPFSTQSLTSQAIDTAKPVVQSMAKDASNRAPAHCLQGMRLRYKRQRASIGGSP